MRLWKANLIGGRCDPALGRALLLGAFVALAAALLFTHLGHYALWDDEADTSLFGLSIWHTGDARAVLGHNVVAYHGGYELRDLKNHLMPPLPSYLVAPFLGLLGPTALAARLPFALCGVAAFLLAAFWLRKGSSSWLSAGVVMTALVANVPLLLYLRQARYYAPAVFLSLALVYLYERYTGDTDRAGEAAAGAGGPDKVWTAGLWALAATALLATHYLDYAALVVVLGADALLWKRRAAIFRDKRIWLAAAIHVAFGAALFLLWNPGAKAAAVAGAPLSERLRLVWWYFRDMNAGEFGIVLLWPAAPLLYLLTGRRLFMRLFVAIGLYVAVLAAVDPPSVYPSEVAPIRYAVPLIPAFAALTSACILTLAKLRPWVAMPLAALAFFTNLPEGGGRAVDVGGRVSCSICDYVEELRLDRATSYGVVADWINQNLAPGQSVWVVPEYAVYPLMFHAPKPTYAWQLDLPRQGQFATLPPVHFKDPDHPPDLIIAFGPDGFGELNRYASALAAKGVRYQHVGRFSIPWDPLIRPEMFWRAFRPLQAEQPIDGVSILKRSASDGGDVARAELPRRAP